MMRRLVIALVLSLGLHGWLLSMAWQRDRLPPALSRANVPLAMQLAYLPKPEPPKAPIVAPPKAPRTTKPEKTALKVAPPKPPAPQKPPKRIKATPEPRPSKPKPRPAKKAIKPSSATSVPPVTPQPVPSEIEPPAIDTGMAPAPASPPQPLPSATKLPDAPEVDPGPPTASIIPALKKATPLYKRNPAPQYPRLAQRRGYQGTVVLAVLVDTQGRVDDLKIFRSSGYTVLDKAAMESVRRWRFEPGRRGDQAVATWVHVPLRFQLR